MSSAEQVSGFRTSLEVERQQLLAQLSEFGGVEYDENFADSAQVAAEQGENRTMLNQLTEALEDVDRALTKFDAGTYGTCERCGATISDARLDAMPATRWCIDCAALV